MEERKTITQKKIDTLVSDIARANEQYDVFVKSGLRKSASAKKLLEYINGLQADLKSLSDQDLEDRKVVAANMLLCIAAADFACESASLFERRLLQVYGEKSKSEDILIKTLQKTATALAEIVVLIDRARSLKVSNNFADMSEEIMETLTETNLEKAAEIVCKYMDAKDGRAFVLTDKEFKRLRAKNRES